MVGYLIGVFSVWCYWDFAAKFSSTEEITVGIIKKDGAQMVAAPVLMLIYLVFYFLMLWPIKWLITKICPQNNDR